ncbi:MAG: acyl-ACP--UDP-N-acetylglucosamine O-acyltransferase [Terrimicrobiaceae bacterium]|nr:acyl-ACP--UDP-N-acetylglucosamine O-acyltransferase [Terrimicrobiaceae bacterium]
MKIHPTAIVEDGAELGSEVEVGPFAFVGSAAIIGNGCRIFNHAVITGRSILGERNFIGHGAVIGAPAQDFGADEATVSEVRIGDDNTFREYVTIHRGSRNGSATVVGDGNLIMVGTHFGHDVRVGNRTVIANNCLLAGHVQVADGAVLGGGTVFHQHMRIGRLAMVRGGTRFGRDIVPFTVADRDNILAGLNSLGLRRAGFSGPTRMELKRLFKLIFRSGKNVSQALAQADDVEWGAEAREMIDFIRTAKKRGICSAHQRHERISVVDEDSRGSDWEGLEVSQNRITQVTMP